MVTLVVSVFSFIIIAFVIEQFLPDNRLSLTIKPVIFCAIIISLFTAFANLKLDISDVEISVEKNNNTQSVWECAVSNCETVLENNMKELCSKRSLDIDEINVEVSSDMKTFKIQSIDISGTDNISAKNLISSYYSISSECIHAIGE